MTDVAAPSAEVLATLTRSRVDVAIPTTAERVAGVLREQVTEGQLRSGVRLPEAALAQALGVSRNTVREALSQLVAERLLVREAHRGVLVAVPDAAAVRDVYRARRLLEPACARAGEAADPVAVQRVRDGVDEGRRAATARDWDGVGTANQHFHRAVVRLAGSSRLDHEMNLLLAEVRLAFHRIPEVRAFHEPYLDRNDEICGLLESGERAAAADMLALYLGDAEHQLVTALADPP